MIRLQVQLSGKRPYPFEWTEPVLKIGRAPANQIVIQSDNISGFHAEIRQRGDYYVFRDLGSTNGSMITRGGRMSVLSKDNPEAPIDVGDRLCLASADHTLLVEAIESGSEHDAFERTILAEQITRDAPVDESLTEDSAALRCVVGLTRQLVGVDDPKRIGDLVCSTCLEAFPKAERAIYLAPDECSFVVAAMRARDSARAAGGSSLLQLPKLLDRCLAEQKGFLFMLEQNQMRAIATMISPVEKLDGAAQTDRVLIGSPFIYRDQCFGLLEVEAPLDPNARQQPNLSRRDLSLATLVCHIVAGRLYDLATQRERLKLARKATAGFMAATVGHCFKNLLFVPTSISKMLPLCLKNNQMDQVEWMLARNSVAIRYLDILSNEFAAASKDPTEGFAPVNVRALLAECAELVNGIAPDRVELRLLVPQDLPDVFCHGAALQRLLMNLTLNAVDAFFGRDRTEKGRIELKAAVDHANNMFCMSVKDNGPGIPESVLENLRAIYLQVKSSADALGELQNIAERVRSTKDQGFKEHYGLGFLFVCMTIRHHAGDLEIESEPDRGARFFMRIPMKQGTIASDV